MAAPFTVTINSATISNTEYSLPSASTVRVAQTTACELDAWIDFNAMTAADTYDVSFYEKVNGGTQRLAFADRLVGVQSELYWIPPRRVSEGWDVTVIKVAGTDRSIGWSLRKDVGDTNTATWNSLATVALPLVPTVAGRTLDCSAGGEAGVDWANIGSPTTTVGLSGTTVKDATDALHPTVAARTLDVSTGGEAGVDWANVGSPTTVLGLSGTTTLAVSGSVGSVTGAVGSVTGAVGSVTGSVGSVAGNVSGNVTGSVGSVPATVATAAAQATAQTDLTTLTGRVTAAVATASALTTAQTDLTTLTGRLTSTRAGYLDNLSAGAVALASALSTAQTDLTTLISRVTAAVATASSLATAQTDLTTIVGRVTAAVATASALATAQTDLTTLVGRVTAAVATASALATAQTAITALPASTWAAVLDAAAPTNAQTALQILNIIISAVTAPGGDLDTDGVVTLRDTGDTKDRIIGAIASGVRTLTSLDGR